MRTGIALIVALGIGLGMSAVSAREQADGKKYDKGATVTLQGCVVAAEKKDTFVLTNVREWPVGNSDMGKFGKRYYWIDKASKEFKGHLGHTVQVIGKISDVEKSEIEFKAGENGMGLNVEVEGPGKDVVTSAGNAAVTTPAGQKAGKNDIPITLLKLKVEEVKMTAATCTPTM
jgi:hypothetical protein